MKEAEEGTIEDIPETMETTPTTEEVAVILGGIQGYPEITEDFFPEEIMEIQEGTSVDTEGFPMGPNELILQGMNGMIEAPETIMIQLGITTIHQDPITIQAVM